MNAFTTDPAYRTVAHFVDGSWTQGGSGTGETVFNPATEEPLGYLPHAATADLERAASAAVRAFEDWRRRTPLERKRILNKAANLLRDRSDGIAVWLTLEEGKALAEAKGEILAAADIFEWYGDECVRVYGRVVPSRIPGATQLVLREPVGPVAAFCPWNFPALTPARKIAGALASGCTIVIKASEETPATCCALVDACTDAGVPAGVLNLVFGIPDEISSFLIPHPGIRKVSFTGSIPVGKHLAKLAAEGVKRCTLELGGHAPVLVFDDAQIEETVKILLAGKFRNAGQVCVAPSRFYVQRECYGRFVEAFASGAQALRVGDGRDPDTQMGPLANVRRLDAMQEMIADARERGHRVAAGGGRIGTRGFFWEPTVVADVDDECRLMREEPFGPVAPIAVFDTTDEVIARANSLPFGLAAFAFTQSPARARAVREGVRAGMIGINHLGISLAEVPFGGVKESGYGSEGGTEGLESYLDTKHVSQLDQ